MTGNRFSGRCKSLETIREEMRIAFHRNASELYNTLIAKALAGDKDLLVYVFDREFGRPRQEIDARVKNVISFSADDYELMSRAALPSVTVEPVLMEEAKPQTVSTETTELAQLDTPLSTDTPQ